MEFTRDDLNQLHDLIFEAIDIEVKDDDEMKKYYEKLPDDIKKNFEHWGMGDTPTVDDAHVWLQSNCK